MTRFLAFAAAVHLATSCERTPGIAHRAPPPVVAALGSTSAECVTGDAHPTTGAPAEGLWLYEDQAAQLRVAAIVGPAQAVAGRSQVTRRIETLEVQAGGDTMRFSSDTAAIRLEFIPPFARPAAVYALGVDVLLASYEPCGAGQYQPLIRYVRRDADGRVATDVLLQREAKP